MLALRALLMFVPSELTINVGRSGTPDVRSFGTHYYGCERAARGNLYTDLRYELIDRHVAPFLAMTG